MRYDPPDGCNSCRWLALLRFLLGMSGTEPVWSAPFTELGLGLADGTHSSIELTELMLERIAQFDPGLHSYATVAADGARRDAESADAEIKASGRRGPLHGVPVAVKDVFYTPDMPTRFGSSIYADFKAPFESTATARLRSAGAVLLGKLTLTEGVYADHHPSVTAPVNPFGATHWTGTSSSGSGVATTAGLCYGSLGTDTGGSIRLPSACCGVTGIKPSWGRVSRNGVFPLAESLDHVGPMARSAADAAALLTAIAGPDRFDPTAAPIAAPDYSALIGDGIAHLMVGVDWAFLRARASAEVIASIEDTITVLERLGAHIIEVTFPNPDDVLFAWAVQCAAEAALAHRDTFPRAPRRVRRPVERAARSRSRLQRGPSGCCVASAARLQRPHRTYVLGNSSAARARVAGRRSDARVYGFARRRSGRHPRHRTVHRTLRCVRLSDDHAAVRREHGRHSDRVSIRRRTVRRSTALPRRPRVSRRDRLASAPAGPSEIQRMKTRLIIDTDTAGDDTFSLLIALRHPGAQLEAVTICNGNVAFDQQVENALYTIEIAGRGGEVPVYRGSARPIMGRRRGAGFHGSDGMSEAHFPTATQRPEAGHAIDAIVDLIMNNPGEISIVAQAPLTNIALAYLKEPRIAQAIKHLWIMGGTDNAVGNASPAAEFNFFVDPEAAKIVFGAGFPITLSTWTLTLSSGSLDAAGVARIGALDTPLSRFFMTVSRVPRERAFERYGKTISTHPDSLTCACAIDERLILESIDQTVDIETGGETTRGYSGVYPPRLVGSWPDRETNARIIRKADTNGFLELLLGVLR